MQNIYLKYQTSKFGLSQKEVNLRLQKHGLNEIIVKKKKNWFLEFLAEFKDLMVIILLIAVVIAAVLGETTDALVIFSIVLLNAVIGFIQKYKAEKAIEALKKLISPHSRVLRNNKEQKIKAKNIVPGDVLILNEGEKINADAILIEANQIKVDESILTGESLPINKDNQKNKTIMMGTAITHGSGKAIVITTGMKTKFGKIAHLTAITKKDLSPLQKELKKIGVFIGKVTIVLCSILFLIGWLFQGKDFVETLIFAVSVAVAAVPEGLPATITIALAVGVQHLAKKRAIMKKLTSVETLGGTTVICSDKTGTLTKNQMTVQKIFSNQETFLVEGNGYTPIGEILKEDNSPLLEREILNPLATASLICNNAKLVKKNKKWEILGDPTEAALISAAWKIFRIKKSKNFKKSYEIPFDSSRKMMTTIFDNKAYVKGATESIIKRSTKILIDNKVTKLTPKLKKEILDKNKEMANNALRVLAFSFKQVKKQEKYSSKETEKDLIFIGLMGMIDPPRPEVKKAIQETLNAGIKTYIVTGDYGPTALAIAKKIGLANSNTKIIEGTEVEKTSKRKLIKLFKKNSNLIFARVKPEHKLKIVSALKDHGEIVAVTGDGVNDAPALKRSDIGIAMGISGTDVSKEAADMILTDDSYGTIVNAIKEGRTIYENMKKFIYYIFSCNVGELITIFIAIAVGLPAPLTAILILLINVGTDILPALALGVDPPENDIMTIPPRSKKTHILNKPFINHFLFTGSIIGIIVIGSYLGYLLQNGWTFGEELSTDSLIYLKASSFAFVLLIFIQMANALNSRSLRRSIFKIGIFSNKPLLQAISLSILMTICFIQIPFFNQYIHTFPLSLKEWGVISLISLIIIPIEEGRKLILKANID